VRQPDNLTKKASRRAGIAFMFIENGDQEDCAIRMIRNPPFFID